MQLVNNKVGFHLGTPSEQNRLYEYDINAIPSGKIAVKYAIFYLVDR